MMLDRTLKILLVSSEVVPFAKTGGLADVAGSLPKALSAMGNDVRVVMPRYRTITEAQTVVDFPVQVGDRKETCMLRESSIEVNFEGIHKKVPVYMIDSYHYFDRDGMYGFYDEAERFAFFSRAVLEMLPKINFKPDVIHCNDWQSGPIPLLLKDQYSHDSFFKNIATVFTVHNLQYQGNFPKECLQLLGLEDRYYHPELLEFYGNMSFMKAGLVYADVINTVSETYAKEIQTPQYGERMDGLLRKRDKDLYGIVNGINYHEFNPQSDPRIYKNFTIDNMQDKKENKYALQREMGLPAKDVPVIGLISRLVDQKGLDLIAAVIDEVMKEDMQFILLGSGEPHYENMFKQMRERFPDKMGVFIGFNGILAQRIYAGCDMFLMPSRFEPCGLGQLISLRYGNIPIVRATGGLADTILDFNPETGLGNGFSFTQYDSGELLKTLRRAVDTFKNHPAQWEKLMRTALQKDFSWTKSAAEYMELYDTAIGKVSDIYRIA